MSKAVKAVGSVFSGGGSTSGAAKAQTNAIKEQTRAVAKREADVEATAAGQRKARSSNRGLLAYMDDFLSSTFGGG